jgi:hypothetical protein
LTALIFEKTCFFGLLIVYSLGTSAGCKAHTDYAILSSQGQHGGLLQRSDRPDPDEVPEWKSEIFSMSGQNNGRM